MLSHLSIVAVLAPLVAVALASPAEAQADGPEQKLVAGETAARNFGQSVAIDGDVAVVGAPGNDSRQGAVYVFKRSGDTWVKTAKLTASDGASDDELGGAVAIDGDTIVAAANEDNLAGSFNQGSLYTFTRTGASRRTETAKLTASDAGEEDFLGQSVAIDGDTIVTSSDDDVSSSSRDQGAVYTFSRTGAARRTQTAKLTTSPRTPGGRLGGSVDIDGDTIVATGDGAVYTFTRSGGNRTPMAKLTVDDGEDLGSSVAIEGDTIVAQASGALYTFGRSGSNRTQTARLTASDGASSDALGHSIDIDGDTIVAGAFGDAFGINRYQGSVYTFSRTGVDRTEAAKLIDPAGADEDYFGFSVAIAGDVILAGADGDETQGSALVFTTPSVLDPVDLCDGQDPPTGNFSTTPETFTNGQEIRLGANFAASQSGAVVTFYRRTDAGQEVIGRDQANSSGNAYLNGFKVGGEEDLFARVGVECTATETLTPSALPQTGTFSATPTTFTTGQEIRLTGNFPSDQGGQMVTFYRKTDTGQEVIGQDAANSYGNAYLNGYQIDGEQRLYATSSTGTTEVDTLTPTTLPQTGTFSATPTTFATGQEIRLTGNFPSDQGGQMVTFYRKTDTGQEVIGRDEANSYGNAYLSGYQIDGEQRLYAITSTGTTEVDTLTPTD
ncbi:MAG: FG-GAP repeat protein [Aeromicrobium sp.]